MDFAYKEIIPEASNFSEIRMLFVCRDAQLHLQQPFDHQNKESPPVAGVNRDLEIDSNGLNFLWVMQIWAAVNLGGSS